MEESSKSKVELGHDFVKRMLLEEDGEKFRQCIQCGACASSCPNGYFMDFPPWKFIAALRANMACQSRSKQHSLDLCRLF